MFRRIDANMLVSGQIHPEDVGRAAAEGVTMIVNNRPDGEGLGQPAGAEIEKAAKAAGLAYRHIPVSHRGLDNEDVDATLETLRSGHQILAFCAVGMRSAILWAFARSLAGDPVDEIIRKAAAAGFDLSRFYGELE